MAQSILEVARELIENPEAKVAYGEDPNGFMAARGLETLTAEELDEAVGFVAEAMPAPVARQLVTPADPVAETLPLARVAAATVVEAGVAEAEPGTVDLTALVDPSGQLDLPTDGLDTASSVDTAEVNEGAQESPDADSSADREAEEDSVDSTTNPDDIDSRGFGTGAPDRLDLREEEEVADETDQLGQTGATDADGAALEPEVDPEPTFAPGDAHASITEPHTAPGPDEEPPGNDLDDVII